MHTVLLLHTVSLFAAVSLAWNVALQCDDAYDVMRQLFVLCHDVSMYMSFLNKYWFYHLSACKCFETVIYFLTSKEDARLMPYTTSLLVIA